MWAFPGERDCAQAGNSSLTQGSRARTRGRTIRTMLHEALSTRLEGAAFDLSDSGEPGEAFFREVAGLRLFY